jgi:hypothetical protein
MNIAVEELLALLVIQQEKDGGTFITKEELGTSLEGLDLGIDWDEERNGIVLFIIEKENVIYDDDDE